MRYELMLPHQIRTAIEKRWPVVLPLGVLEYHGEHLGVGMDTIAVVRLLELLEREMDLVILPPFYYGAASFAVVGPENTGSLQVDSGVLHPFARELFKGLLRIGFRNLHFIIHHQTENFDAGMPTDLAFKFAARQVIFEYLEASRGEGWWGKSDMADYYSQHEAGTDPFNWIKGHALTSPEIWETLPFDHAGKGETSLMMSLAPEAVDMSRHSNDEWFTRDAVGASAEIGNAGRDLILKRLRTLLGEGR